MAHPWADVAIVGVHNTRQARRIEGATVHSLCVEAVLGACADAGVPPAEIDGVVGMSAGQIIYDLGIGPAARVNAHTGIPTIAAAASLILTGQATVVVVAGAGAAMLSSDGSAASWTRPQNELTAPFGLFTAAEMAFMARRHMITYGTTHEQMAHVAATIRNNAHVNPAAVYFDRGPFTTSTIADSPLIADPFHLLDCATVSEGGAALVLTSAERAVDLRSTPAWILGTASDALGQSYTQAPSFDLAGSGSATDESAGWVGRRAARMAFAQAGLSPDDVDVCEFYDPFSFEIIRQFEAFGFCAQGEGGHLVTSGAIEPEGKWPVTTDGGTMAFAHPGINAQMFQRVIRGVQQVRGECPTMQVSAAEVAMCSNGGSGALFTDVMLVGSTRP